MKSVSVIEIDFSYDSGHPKNYFNNKEITFNFTFF